LNDVDTQARNRLGGAYPFDMDNPKDVVLSDYVKARNLARHNNAVVELEQRNLLRRHFLMTEEEVNTTHNTIRVYRDEANKFK
jgi:hypothetical protein